MQNDCINTFLDNGPILFPLHTLENQYSYFTPLCCEICKKNTFSQKTPQVAASVFSRQSTSCLKLRTFNTKNFESKGLNLETIYFIS